MTDFDSMEKIWFHCLYNCLKMDSQEQNVLLSVSSEWTEEDHRRSSEIFFEYLNCQSYYPANQGMLGLFSTGLTKGIVLDSGEGGTHVVPVYEGYVLPYGVSKTNIRFFFILHYFKL